MCPKHTSVLSVQLTLVIVHLVYDLVYNAHHSVCVDHSSICHSGHDIQGVMNTISGVPGGTVGVLLDHCMSVCRSPLSHSREISHVG